MTRSGPALLCPRRAKRGVFVAPIVGDTLPELGVGEVDSQVKTAGGVCLNGGLSGQMALQTRADLQNQAIG